MAITNKKSEEKNYSTYDLGVASCLVSKGYILVSLDKTDRKKVKFIFRSELGIDELVESYWTDKLEIKARTFFDNIRMLKNRLHSE